MFRRFNFINLTSVNFEKNRIILSQLQNSLRRDRDFEFISFKKVKFVKTRLAFELLKIVSTKTFKRELVFKKKLSTVVQMLSARSF